MFHQKVHYLSLKNINNESFFVHKILFIKTKMLKMLLRRNIRFQHVILVAILFLFLFLFTLPKNNQYHQDVLLKKYNHDDKLGKAARQFEVSLENYDDGKLLQAAR